LVLTIINNIKLFVLCINIDKNRKLSRETRNAMYLILTLNTQEEVLTILNDLQSCGEPGIIGNY